MKLNGTYVPVPDKSMTHRALIMSAMACGRSTIANPLTCFDCDSTIHALRLLGAEIDELDGRINVVSNGYKSFAVAPDIGNNPLVLPCGNSGTTARLIAGALAPRNINVKISGDDSLNLRPMTRIIEPLIKMGANIVSTEDNGRLPIEIRPSKMHNLQYSSEVPSAQVKSAFLLAALQTEGVSTYVEQIRSRDHTERMLPLYGVSVSSSGEKLVVNGPCDMRPADFLVPGDASAAATIIVAAHMFEESRLNVNDVGLNPTRTEFLSILQQWGAELEVNVTTDKSATEPIGCVRVLNEHKLTGGLIAGASSQRAIDELPLLAMLGLFTREPVEIRQAGELKYKESNRIHSTVFNLRAIGAEVAEFDDGLIVYPLFGKEPNINARLNNFNDHRIAMMNVILAKRFGLQMPRVNSLAVSYPNFVADLEKLII
ncbi:3-phosphoshikimate 1-carboxyvinyltransferase [Deferribacterales bacterium RsTz2092]|nr:3-phosphoshikimate 1-carboxyvinyltransferase [Deferribacterales bacterium]